MSRRFLIGMYDHEHKVLEAVQGLRKDGWQVHDVYTPYPVPGMDKALGLKHSRLGWVTAMGALGGALGVGGTEIYVAVIAWPVNIGGRPMASLPAFFPPVFEIAVLGAALSTVGALLWVSGLFPGSTPRLEIPDVTNNRFGVALDADQAPKAAEKIAAFLRGSGAVEVLERQEVEQ